MVFKTVTVGMDGIKELLINSTKILNIIAFNQTGILHLIIDAELKQNSELFAHDVRLRISPSREVSRVTRLFDHHGQGE